MSEEPKLPRVPSKLIQLALADLAKVEADPRYVVDMHDWHEPERSGQCSVCLAESLMAGTLGADLKQGLEPWHFGADEYVLLAVNCFRSGHIERGLIHLLGGDYEATEIPDYFTVTPYQVDAVKFRSQMNAMADMLETKGL